MADNANLAIRLPRQVLEDARRYARAQGTTPTHLVSEYLRRLPAEDDLLARAPI